MQLGFFDSGKEIIFALTLSQEAGLRASNSLIGYRLGDVQTVSGQTK